MSGGLPAYKIINNCVSFLMKEAIYSVEEMLWKCREQLNLFFIRN